MAPTPPWVLSRFWVCWGRGAEEPSGGEGGAELNVGVQRGLESWGQWWNWEARWGSVCSLELGCTNMFGQVSVGV